jgi:hypothetical protein
MMRRSHLAGPGSMREVFIFHSSCIYSKPFLPAVSDLRHHSSMSSIKRDVKKKLLPRPEDEMILVSISSPLSV